jgi:hypothetical protein
LVGHAGTLSKGTSGICQTVVVPSSNPQLTLWMYEGGGTYDFNEVIHLGLIFDSSSVFAPIVSFVPDVGGTAYTSSNTPSTVLFAQNNCFNTSPTGKSGDLSTCAIGGSAAFGGQWYQKGPYDLSAYAGHSVTIMLGLWGSSDSTSFYGYAFYDDVVLSGS